MCIYEYTMKHKHIRYQKVYSSYPSFFVDLPPFLITTFPRVSNLQSKFLVLLYEFLTCTFMTRDDCGLNVLLFVPLNPCKGAQVDIQDKSGSTACIEASTAGRADVVNLLLEAGQYTHLY